MERLLFLKGIIIGIAKVIPGFSGALLMISFNLYDRALYVINHFFDDVKRNFIFLFRLGLGISVGIVFFSKLLVFFLDRYYFFTYMFFIGLIFGGIPGLSKNFSKNKRHITLCIFSFLFIVLLSFNRINYVYFPRGNYLDILVFFLAGILEGIGTIVPGVSSTALLMLIGIYSYYLKVISHLFSFYMVVHYLSFLIPFSVGMVLSFLFLSVLFNYLFCFFREDIFACVFGFSIGSVVVLIFSLFSFVTNTFSIVVGILLFVIGCFITGKI